MNKAEKEHLEIIHELWVIAAELDITLDKQYPYGLDKQWELGEGK